MESNITMGTGKIVNTIFKPLGLKVCRIENEAVNLKHGNRYSLESETLDGLSREARKLLNLLHYTKQNSSTYNAGQYDSGYHTIELDGQKFVGQRVPQDRLKLVPFDFSEKIALDLGCNQGGMLMEVASLIKQGIGLDYDYKMINAANRVKSHKGNTNLNFFVFDLENENLDVIDNFLPDKVDIVFLLSVCMWIKNWREVINKVHSISDTLLFESNGTMQEQEEQLQKLEQSYSQVQLLQDSSPDDPKQKKRKLYLCKK